MVWSTDMGIDLGTATVLVYLKGKGIILNEPSVVAIEKQARKVLAVGESAQKMLGRTPGNITAIRPLREGVIADFDVTEAMLKHFILKVGRRRRIFKPRVVVCIPAATTSVEKKAVIEAINRTGARDAFLIEEPRAAALGAGLDIFQPSGSMVVDIGGGTTDIAVLSMGETVVCCSVRVGGDKFDESIVRYIKKEFNLLIGERTAEAMKVQIGSAFLDGQVGEMDIRGRDLVTGLPRSIRVNSEQVHQAIHEPLWVIVQGVRKVLERTSPELAGDIMEKGIVLTGGGAMLDGFHKLIASETGVPAYLADDPIGSVATGTGKALEYLDKLAGTLITRRNLAAAL